MSGVHVWMRAVAVAIIAASGVAPEQRSPAHAQSREYNVALGVECGHCHSETDFADSSKPTFDFARRMARMVSGLNEGPLEELGAISCWTCHRGHVTPARLPRADWNGIATAHAAEFTGGRPNLGLAMAVYSASLGVACSHCHTDGDWKDASKPAHRTVPRMLSIFDLIPTYFDQSIRAPQTQCFMCHHGRVDVEHRQPDR
jgi:formate-dependent nitrite reductase cytochrome c552 subunit